MSEHESQRRDSSGIRLPVWAAALLFLVAAAAVIGSGVWLFGTVRSMVADTGTVVDDLDFNVTESQASESGGGVVSAENPLADPQITITDGENPETISPIVTTPDPDLDLSTFTPWQGTERVNVLLLGIDSRCEEEGPVRTDSMILISIDPVNKTASALSLPRDIWVEIPVFGPDRINKAHFLGEINSWPGGGPALSMQTVENFIGIPVEHYLAVNFEAFRDFINLIDGIQVDVPEAISDPTYPDECYGYDPFYINSGIQSMNGPIALKYARTRATEGGDIDRAARQQAVIFAVRNKLVDVQMIPTLIARAPRLWSSFSDNVRTSLTETEAIQLALLVQEIQQQNINMGVIDYNYVNDFVTPDNQYVLVPDYAEISNLRDELFPTVRAPSAGTTVNNLTQRVLEEDATVAIWNGTQTVGLAAATEEYLIGLGVNVVEIGNADSSVEPTTRVYDYADNEYTRLYLKEVMGLRPLNVVQESESAPGDFDVLIVLGAGWEVPGDG